MNTKDFNTTLLLRETPAEVYAAINRVSGWWQGEIEGSAGTVGDEFTYRMRDLHFSRQRVLELVPGEKIVWLVTESHLSFLDGKDEWTGTRIRFDIAATADGTRVTFSHEGLTPAIECYAACSDGWSRLIGESLRSLVTTGTGTLVF